MKVVSLSSARKAKARTAQKALADANALRFGRTKTEKAKDDATNAKTKAALEAHKIAP